MKVRELSGTTARMGPSDISKKLGLQIQDLTEDRARLYGITATKGVIITAVAAYSPAYMNGIKPGDIIPSVNRKPIGSVLEFNKELRQTGQEKKVLLLLKEDKYTPFVVF